MTREVRPWYKKKRYAIPLGVIGFTAVASAAGSTPEPVVQPIVAPIETRSLVEAATASATSPGAVQIKESVDKEEVKEITKPRTIAPSRVYDEPEVSSPACCKYCSKGKACGDSCISRSYTCHQGPGCACDS